MGVGPGGQGRRGCPCAQPSKPADPRDDVFATPQNRPEIKTVQDWVKDGTQQPTRADSRNKLVKSIDTPPTSLEEALENCPDCLNGNVEPLELLTACLGIESVCRGNVEQLANRVEGEARVEVMIDEPGFRYCMCHSPVTPLVTGFFWIEIAGITVEEVVRALGNKRERREWDAGAEFNILRDMEKDDPDSSEVTFHMLKAPWPFYDREVLQRRSRMNLAHCDPKLGEGVAFVAQSVEDPTLLVRNDDRIRAIVHMMGHLIRPLLAENSQGGQAGVSVTVCNKLDIGGVAPPWAQSLICRFASKQSQNWSAKLKQHCLTMRAAGRVKSSNGGVNSAALDMELADRELMGL